MNIPVELLAVFLTAVIGLQAWILTEVVNLKAKFAAMVEHCKLCSPTETETETNIEIKHERPGSNHHPLHHEVAGRLPRSQSVG